MNKKLSNTLSLAYSKEKSSFFSGKKTAEIFDVIQRLDTHGNNNQGARQQFNISVIEEQNDSSEPSEDLQKLNETPHPEAPLH